MKKITVPAAGELSEISIAGLGIYVMPGAPTYDNIEDYPSISFESPGGFTYPLGPGATWGYERCGFGTVWIKGTTESAGTELYILPLATCPEPTMSADPGIVGKSESGQTFTRDATDAVQQFTEVEMQNAAGDLPVGAAVQARDNPIAYAFDDDPDQAVYGKILVPPVVPADPSTTDAVPGDLIELDGLDEITKFRWIAAVNTFTGKLIVTFRYYK